MLKNKGFTLYIQKRQVKSEGFTLYLQKRQVKSEGFTLYLQKRQVKSEGFTLIELLVVIAVIGVLGAVLLAIINPLEQLGKARDSGRRSSVSQLGKGIEAYYISTGAYPAASATWQDLLGSSGSNDLKKVLAAPSGPSANCNTNNHNNFCYDTSAAPDAIVWTIAESKTEKSKCGANTAIIVWVASQGKTGIGCVGSASTAPPTPYSSFVVKD